MNAPGRIPINNRITKIETTCIQLQYMPFIFNSILRILPFTRENRLGINPEPEIKRNAILIARRTLNRPSAPGVAP
ncbi:hypothetical protein, partial [Burkholderia gladioli]|uniref:hypothetical protein n=1 Tax=Burkholderia gladioli TaxID=28095 RepID=UPI0034DAE9C5